MRELRARMERLSAAAAWMDEVAAEWSTREYAGSADGGRITATVDAVGTLRALDIHPLGMRRLDSRALAEAVLTAVRRAEAAAEAAKEEMLRGGLEAAGLPHMAALLGDARRAFDERASPGGAGRLQVSPTGRAPRSTGRARPA
ncbi:YbaB/EbfC family nucleoid-associated protein [Microbispora bryophytorum]|uniref:YbaB/EbfC family nucleoid-associated protein n=1 Tax=Microbispora bryophytorum TaxID=1460882 RepID=UPI00340DEA49